MFFESAVFHLGAYLFIVSLALTLLLTPLATRLGRRWEVLDLPDPRKVHNAPIPLVGGWIVFGVLTLVIWGHLGTAWLLKDTSALTWLPAEYLGFTRRIPELVVKLLPIFLGALGIFALGVLDDVKGLSVRFRFRVQLLITIPVVLLGVRPSLHFLPDWASVALAILWIVGMTNAFNLLDGLDGLSAGVSLIGSVALLAVMGQGGQQLVPCFLATLAGAQLGFLRANWNPARIFLGSSGSLLLGYFMGVTTILATYVIPGSPNPLVNVLIPVFILAVPLYDTASVILIRFLSNRSVAIADQSHFHHRLMRLGFSQRQTVLFIWLIAFAVAMSSVVLVRASTGLAVVILLQIVAMLSIIILAERVAATVRGEVLSRVRQGLYPRAPGDSARPPTSRHVRKKIVLVANTDWYLFNFRLSLAQALRDQGWQVHLVCPRGEYSDKLSQLGFSVVDWRMGRRGFGPLKQLTAIIDLTRTYARIKPDVVHHFTLKSIVFGGLAAQICLVPRVINTFTGLGYTFTARLKAHLIRFVLLPVLRATSICTNTWNVFQVAGDRDQLTRMSLIDAGRAHVISGSGVNPSVFHPKEGGPSPEGPVHVVMAARLLVDKGVREYVEAAAILLTERKLPARFTIAGAEDPGNPAAIPPATLEEWRKSNVVSFLGHCPTMPELLRSAHIAVLPSYHEGVSRFLLEAAASGLPIVTTDLEGSRRVVVDGENGFLIPVKDARTLADRLAELIDDADLRRRMGAASRRRVETELSDQVIVRQHLELYEEVVGQETGAFRSRSEPAEVS